MKKSFITLEPDKTFYFLMDFLQNNDKISMDLSILCLKGSQVEIFKF